MTDMIIPMDGEICLASSNDGNATSLIWLNSVTRPKLIKSNSKVTIIPPISPP